MQNLYELYALFGDDEERIIPMLEKKVGTMQRCAQRSTDRQSTMNVRHDLAYSVEIFELEVGAPPAGYLESAYDRMAQM